MPGLYRTANVVRARTLRTACLRGPLAERLDGTCRRRRDRPAAKSSAGDGSASGAQPLSPDKTCQVREEAGVDVQGDAVGRREAATHPVPCNASTQLGGTDGPVRFGECSPKGHRRLRVDPADSGTTTRPRAPGKTGPPVEITACRLNKGWCFAAPPSPHDHRSRPASNAESEVPRPRSLSFLKGVSRAR